MKKIIVGLIIVFLLSFIVNPQKASAEKGNITFGWIGPVSGPVSILGDDNLKAVQLAIDEYHDSKKDSEPHIDLIVKDDQYKAEKSLKAYDTLISENKADIIFLSTYSAMFNIAGRALEDDVIIINPLDNDGQLADLNKNIFCIAKQTESFAGVVVEGLIDQDKTNACIIYFNDDEFMPSMAKYIKNYYQKAGGKVMSQSYPADTKEFKPLIQACQEGGADSYVFLGYFETKEAMEQGRGLGIADPYFAINVHEGTSEGTQIAHFTYLDGNPGLAQGMLGRFEKKFGHPPRLSWLAFQAYDATNITLRAVKRTVQEKGEFVNKIRKHLLTTNSFRGTAGDISIKPDGTSRGIYASLYTFKNGKTEKNQ